MAKCWCLTSCCSCRETKPQPPRLQLERPPCLNQTDLLKSLFNLQSVCLSTSCFFSFLTARLQVVFCLPCPSWCCSPCHGPVFARVQSSPQLRFLAQRLRLFGADVVLSVWNLVVPFNYFPCFTCMLQHWHNWHLTLSPVFTGSLSFVRLEWLGYPTKTNEYKSLH